MTLGVMISNAMRIKTIMSISEMTCEDLWHWSQPVQVHYMGTVWEYNPETLFTDLRTQLQILYSYSSRSKGPCIHRSHDLTQGHLCLTQVNTPKSQE